MSDNARDDRIPPLEGAKPASSPPTPPRSGSSSIWRGILYATAIHFSILAFGAWHGIDQGFDDPSLLFAFHPIRFGLVQGLALWLFLNTNWIWLMLLGTDLVALVLLWRFVQGRRSVRLATVYLTAVLVTAAVHVGGVVYAARIGTFSTPQRTYVLSNDIASSYALMDVFLAAPGCLILLASLTLGWPRRGPGVCSSCGYDLRATPDRCPECGTTTREA